MLLERQGSKPWRSFCVFLLGVAIAFCARYIFTHTFYIPSSSMEPTVSEGQRVWISPSAKQYKRGDIIVFKSSVDFDNGGTPSRSSSNAFLQWLGFEKRNNQYLKRIIGVGGDKISCDAIGKQMTLNGQVVSEPYLEPSKELCQSVFHVEVPSDHYWVEGDNRDHSSDSRSHLGSPGGGFIDQDDVIGQAQRIIFPLSQQKKL
ncbi:MAG: signal peptidase I [Micrococcaceae bacterium]